jgi:hypothetical protein
VNNDTKQFNDPETGDVLRFHVGAFKKLISGIIAKYLNKSEQEAISMVDNHNLFSKPIQTFGDAIFFSHEPEYHWAMLIAYGESYWLKGIPSDPPEGYDEWESAYIAQHHLPSSSFEWLSDDQI